MTVALYPSNSMVGQDHTEPFKKWLWFSIYKITLISTGVIYTEA